MGGIKDQEAEIETILGSDKYRGKGLEWRHVFGGSKVLEINVNDCKMLE